MSVISVNDISSLEVLNNALKQFYEQGLATVQGFASTLYKKIEYFESKESILLEKVRIAESALDSCYIARANDPPEYKRSCYSQEEALERAIANYNRYQTIMSQVMQTQSEYYASTETYNQSLHNLSSSSIPKLNAVITDMRKYYNDNEIIFSDRATLPGGINIGGTGFSGISDNEFEKFVRGNSPFGQKEAVVDEASRNNLSIEPTVDFETGDITQSAPLIAAGAITLGALITGGIILAKGAKNDEVGFLQNQLIDLGYKGLNGTVLISDDDFGNNTENALKKFQKDFGLDQTGVADEKVWKKLEEIKEGVPTFFELKKFFPGGKNENLAALWSTLKTDGEKFGITDKTLLAHFLAQVGHESIGLSSTTESLNYSVEALAETFKEHFFINDIPNGKYDAKLYGYINDANGKRIQYSREQDIGNIAYGNKNGNGNFESGEGYKYRGRGFMQLTGKDNFQGFTNFMKETGRSDVDFVEEPHRVAEPTYSALSALWFFKNKVLEDKRIINKSNPTVKQYTLVVNGGYNGLEDREKYFDKAIKMLGIEGIDKRI